MSHLSALLVTLQSCQLWTWHQDGVLGASRIVCFPQGIDGAQGGEEEHEVVARAVLTGKTHKEVSTSTALKQGQGFESDQTSPNQRQGAGSNKEPLGRCSGWQWHQLRIPLQPSLSACWRVSLLTESVFLLVRWMDVHLQAVG